MFKFIAICVIIWIMFHWWLVPLINSVKKSAENSSLKRELQRLERRLDRYE